MTRALCWILLLLPAAPALGEASVGDQESPRVQAHIVKGYKYLKRKKYPKAIEELEAARELSQGPCFICLEGIARAYERSKMYQDAVRAYEELLARERRIRSTWSPPPQAMSTAAFVENRSCSQDHDTSGLGEPRHVGGDVRKPEKISAPQPQYTDADRKRRIQGVVIVQAIIDDWGCVRATRVIEGLSEGLDEEALKAIRQWRFRPATLNGEPVAVYYNLTVNFRLQ